MFKIAFSRRLWVCKAISHPLDPTILKCQIALWFSLFYGEGRHRFVILLFLFIFLFRLPLSQCLFTNEVWTDRLRTKVLLFFTAARWQVFPLVLYAAPDVSWNTRLIGSDLWETRHEYQLFVIRLIWSSVLVFVVTCCWFCCCCCHYYYSISLILPFLFFPWPDVPSRCVTTLQTAG